MSNAALKDDYPNLYLNDTNQFDTNDLPRFVVNRKVGEEIILHDDEGFLGKIKVYFIGSGRVKLCFEVDERLQIDRRERLSDK